MELNAENQEIKKTINWVYLFILGGPSLLFTVTLAIVSALTPVFFIGDWQIWTFIFAVPVLGFVGGFFVTREELQISLTYGCVFIVAFMALITSGVAGGIEIIERSSFSDIFFAFSGGILYGGVFGLVDCVFVVLATFASYGIKLLVKQRKIISSK